MKLFKIFALLSLIIIAVSASCTKTAEIAQDDTYISCKINGQIYLPNNCANCAGAKLLGDTILIINSNAGYETMLIGVININGMPIVNMEYTLNDNPHYRGIYKNSTTTDDRFDTDAIRNGKILITSINKTKRIITGTFHFQAYNPLRNLTVDVSEGVFRFVYTTN